MADHSIQTRPIRRSGVCPMGTYNTWHLNTSTRTVRVRTFAQMTNAVYPAHHLIRYVSPTAQRRKSYLVRYRSGRVLALGPGAERGISKDVRYDNRPSAGLSGLRVRRAPVAAICRRHCDVSNYTIRCKKKNLNSDLEPLQLETESHHGFHRSDMPHCSCWHCRPGALHQPAGGRQAGSPICAHRSSEAASRWS